MIKLKTVLQVKVMFQYLSTNPWKCISKEKVQSIQS
jgi:hypothetical protein